MSAKILGIIPARYASTRFPGKPLVHIMGKTLLQRTYENATKAKVFDQIIVATDDYRIMEHTKAFGGQAILTSSDCLTGTDRIAEVLELHPHLTAAQIIVNIQGDEPCVSPVAIHQMVQLLLDDASAQVATVVTYLKNAIDASNPAIVKCIIDRHCNAIYFSRALIPNNKEQKFDPSQTYYHHIGIYAYRPDFIQLYQKLAPTPLQLAESLEQLKILEHGYRIKVAITEQPSFGVDTPEDIHKVEQWLCKQNTFLSLEESAPHLAKG